MINIILYRPEKPANLGNIMRTCSATNCNLIVIGPLSFELDDKSLKRAGMDYLEELNYKYFNSYEEFLKNYDCKHIFYVTRYSKNVYSDQDYSDIVNDIYFMFGRESTGIPHEILLANEDKTIRLPMIPSARSLNLSNCVSIVVYEALKQRKFYGLSTREAIKGEDFLINEKKIKNG